MKHDVLLTGTCSVLSGMVLCQIAFLCVVASDGRVASYLLQIYNAYNADLLIMGPNWTYHASRFILVHFFFNFSVCPVWWTKLFTVR